MARFHYFFSLFFLFASIFAGLGNALASTFIPSSYPSVAPKSDTLGRVSEDHTVPNDLSDESSSDQDEDTDIIFSGATSTVLRDHCVERFHKPDVIPHFSVRAGRIHEPPEFTFLGKH